MHKNTTSGNQKLISVTQLLRKLLAPTRGNLPKHANPGSFEARKGNCEGPTLAARGEAAPRARSGRREDGGRVATGV